MSCKIHSCCKVQERHVNCCRECLRSSACMQSQIDILYLPLNELVVSYLCKQKLAKHRIGEASCDFSRIHRVFSDNCFGLVVFESDWIQSDSEKSAHKGTKTNHFSILKCCWYISTWDVFNNPDKKSLDMSITNQPTRCFFISSLRKSTSNDDFVTWIGGISRFWEEFHGISCDVAYF